MKSFAFGLVLSLLPALAVAQPQIPAAPSGNAPEFKDVTIGSPETGTMRIGRLTLSNPVEQGDRLTTAQAQFENVQIAVGTSRTEVPKIIIKNFAASKALVDALSKSGGWDRDWATLFDAASADELTIPSVEIRDTASRTEASYKGFALKSLSKGRAQSARLATTASKSVVPTGEDIVSTMGEAVYENIDLTEMIRFVTGGGSGAKKPLIDRVTVVNFAMKMPQAQMDVAKVEMIGFVGRAPAMAMPVGAILATQGVMPQDGPVAQQLAAYYRELLQNFEVDRYAFRGIKLMSDIGPIQMGDIEMDKFSGAGMGRFSIGGIGLALPTGPFKLGGFEITGLNWKNLVDMGLQAAATGKEPDLEPAQILPLIPTLDALRFVKLDVGTPFGPASFDEVSFSLPGKTMPEAVGLLIKALKVDLSQLPPTGGLEFVQALGYKEVTMNAQARVRYVAAERALVLEVPAIDLSDVGTIDLVAKFVDVDLPAGAEKIEDARFNSLTLGVTDKGLGNRAFGMIGKTAGISAEAMRAAIGTELKVQAARMFGPALTPGSAEAVEDFIKNGQRIVLTAKPKPGAPPLTLIEMQAPPPAYLDRVTVTIERPPAGRLNIMDQLKRP